jgi:hypothetical protein
MRDHPTRPGSLLESEQTEPHHTWNSTPASSAPDASRVAARELSSAFSERAVTTLVSERSRTSLRQRRREPRLQPVEDRIWMQWWQDGELLGRSARLINISRHGAMIISSALTRSGQIVRIYLEEPAPQIGVAATVLQVVEGVHGVHQIRLGLTDSCPDAFLEAAAGGFEAWLQHDLSRA